MPSPWLLLAAGYGLAWLWAASAGRRLPGRPGWGRVRAAALWVAGAAALPLVALLVLPLRWGDAGLPFFPSGDGSGVHPLAVLAAFAVSLRFALSAVRLPGVYGRPDALPEVDDPELVARVSELASAMGVERPRLLRLGSGGSTLTTEAFAHGVVVPTLIVSDGILHRLAPAERDAVLAHELAHVRRRSVPQMVWIAAASMLAMALASALVPALAAIAWGLLLFAGALRLHGHFDEVACDLAAARVVGAEAMARALDKIHGSNLPDDDRLLSRLVHATQRHPGRSVRLHALQQAAPAGAGAGPAVNPATVARHRRTYVLAALLWVAMLVLGLLWAMEPGQWPFAAALCVLASSVPGVLLLVARAREIWYHFQLGTLRPPWGRLLDAALVGGSLLALFSLREPGTRLALGCGLLVAGGILLRHLGPALRRRRWLDLQFRRHEFAAFAETFAALPERQRRDPRLRYLAAVARAAAGDRAGAVEELRALLQDHPRFWAAKLSLSALLRPLDAAASLALAEELARRLPANPYALGRLAAARLQTGDVAGALQAARRGLRAEPRAGILHALAARAAAQDGELAAAGEHLAAAERWAAGDIHVLLARVELARAAGGDVDSACRELREAVAHQPLAFADDEVEALCGAGATN